MWEMMWEKMVTALQTPTAGVLYSGFAIYLICEHIGVTWWERTVILFFFAAGYYVLAEGPKRLS
jgi:hypothetical protein